LYIGAYFCCPEHGDTIVNEIPGRKRLKASERKLPKASKKKDTDTIQSGSHQTTFDKQQDKME